MVLNFALASKQPSQNPGVSSPCGTAVDEQIQFQSCNWILFKDPQDWFIVKHWISPKMVVQKELQLMVLVSNNNQTFLVRQFAYNGKHWKSVNDWFFAAIFLGLSKYLHNILQIEEEGAANIC